MNCRARSGSGDRPFPSSMAGWPPGPNPSAVNSALVPSSVGSGASARSTSTGAVRGWAPGMRLGRACLHGRAGPLRGHSGCLASASACAERSAPANSEARAAQADSPSRSNRPAAWSCARAASKCMSSDLNQANRATSDSADVTGQHYFARRRGQRPTRSQRYHRMQTAWTEPWCSEAWDVVTRLTRVRVSSRSPWLSAAPAGSGGPGPSGLSQRGPDRRIRAPSSVGLPRTRTAPLPRRKCSGPRQPRRGCRAALGLWIASPFRRRPLAFNR